MKIPPRISLSGDPLEAYKAGYLAALTDAEKHLTEFEKEVSSGDKSDYPGATPEQLRAIRLCIGAVRYLKDSK